MPLPEVDRLRRHQDPHALRGHQHGCASSAWTISAIRYPGDGDVIREFDHDSTSNDPDRGHLRCYLRRRVLLGDFADDES